MTQDIAAQAREQVDAVYRSESRRVLATLIRLLGDFDLAEEALHDAFASAVEQWARDGVPANPRAWLVSAGRFQGDRRRSAAAPGSTPSLAVLADRLDADARQAAEPDEASGRGRSAAADLHLLPSGPAARRADRADAARGLRTHDRRDRARLSDRPARRWPSGLCGPRRRSARARFPIRCRREKICRNAWIPCLHVIYLVFNEGYSGFVGRIVDEARSVGRGDPLGAPVAGAACPSRRSWDFWR